MKAKEMLEHYKLHDERVDEVLYQTVMGELNDLQITITQFFGECNQQVDVELVRSLSEACPKHVATRNKRSYKPLTRFVAKKHNGKVATLS